MEQLFSFGLVILIMATGFAFMIGGSKSAGKVFTWPFRTIWNLFLSLVGGALVSTGNAIKPKKKKRRP
jgi:hypothetical protein